MKQKSNLSVKPDLPKTQGRRGLSLPIRANASGGLATSTGDIASFDRISVALGDGDNINAWRQENSLGQQMIFDISDPQVRARIRARLNVVFDRFEREKRFKLLPETIRWIEGPGSLELEFTYHDLESDEFRPFSRLYKGN